MRLLTRYLVLATIGPFVFGVTAFTSIIAGFSLISLARNPIMSGGTVLKLTCMQIPQNLSIAFPMGVLLGTLFALGQLSSHSEVVAMRAGGLSGLRIIAPFLLFGLLASLGSLYLSQVVVPYSNRNYARELAQAKGQSGIEILRRQVLPPEFDRDGELKRLIYVGEFDLKNLYLRKVQIYEFEKGQERIAVNADEMIWDGSAWRFQRGEVRFTQPDGSTTRLQVRGGRADYQPLLPKPREISAAATDPNSLTWQEFRAFIAQREQAGEDTHRYLVDLYSRLAIPFACLAMAVIGTPLGIQTRRSGTAMSFGLAILILFAYFFLLSFAQVLGRSGALPPAVAAWSANVILCVVGIVLFKQRMR